MYQMYGGSGMVSLDTRWLRGEGGWEEGDGVRQGAGNEIRANRMRSDLEGLLAIQHKQTST